MNTKPHNLIDKDQIIAHLQQFLSSNTHLMISEIEAFLNKQFISPVNCAQELLDYITITPIDDSANSSTKQKIDLMIVIWLNHSIKQSYQAKLLKESDMKKLIILYFNILISGKANIKVINQLIRLFEYLLNQSSSSIFQEIISNFIKLLFYNPNSNPFSLSYFTGVMKILHIFTQILIRKIHNEINHLNDLFGIIERLLLDTTKAYESIALAYIDQDYSALFITVTIIKKIYSYYKLLFKSKPDVISKIKHFIRLDTIVYIGIKVIFLRLPSKSRFYPMVLTSNNQFDIELNIMKITIYKVLTLLIKDHIHSDSNDEIFEINYILIGRTLQFLEGIINYKNYLKSIAKVTIQTSIYSRFISELLEYCFTILKIDYFKSFLSHYLKHFVKGILFQLLEVNINDEVVINHYSKEYLAIIEDAGTSMRLKQYTTKAALVLREICKDESIANYFWDYIMNSINKTFDCHQKKSKLNNRELSQSENYSMSITTIISSKLQLCYLMPKNKKGLSSIKELISKNGLFNFCNDKSTPFVIKLHFSLIIKQYNIDLFNSNGNDNINFLLRYLCCNINLIDNKKSNNSFVLSHIASSTMKKIYQRNDPMVNSKLIEIIDEVLTKSTSMIDKMICNSPSHLFIRIIYQIIRQTSIKGDDILKAFKILCKTFNTNCFKLLDLMKTKAKNDNALVNTTICIKGLKTMMLKVSFIKKNMSEIDSEMDNQIIPLMQFTLLHCYEDIIDIVIKYTSIKKAMTNKTVIISNDLIVDALQTNKEISLHMFKIMITYLVYNKSGIQCNNNSNCDSIINSKYKIIITYFENQITIEEGNMNAFKVTMLLTTLLRNNEQVNLNKESIVKTIIQSAIPIVTEIASKIINTNEINDTIRLFFASLMILIYSGFLYYPQQTIMTINQFCPMKQLVELNSMIFISDKYITLKKFLIEGLCSMLTYELIPSLEELFLNYLLMLIIETKEYEAQYQDLISQRQNPEDDEDNEKVIQTWNANNENGIESNSYFDTCVIDICDLVLMNKEINVFMLFADVIRKIHLKDSTIIQNWIGKLLEEKRSSLLIPFYLQNIVFVDNNTVVFQKKISTQK